MSKSRSLSVYLLKKDFDETNALADDHTLQGPRPATRAPQGSVLYLARSAPRPPWWETFLGISDNLNQNHVGGILFLKAKARCFAIAFGHVAHWLDEDALEYDFGLKVTLNIVDPNKLKSTDVLEPDAARRQRTQSPIDNAITFFDFEQDSTVLQRLTGKARDEHKDLITNATGSHNLRINTSAPARDLAGLCERLADLYESEAYKETFPNLRSVTPVRDPTIIDQLNGKLVTALRHKAAELNLAIPKILDYEDNIYVTFSGEGASLVHDDLFLQPYYDYLTDKSFDLSTLLLDDLQRQRIHLTNEEGEIRDTFSVFKCLIFDCASDTGEETYHLCGGNWYCVAKEFIAELAEFLDPLCIDTELPDYAHSGEADYNIHAAGSLTDFVCLDMSNISPPGQTQIEPCDLFTAHENSAHFFHVKLSTLSSRLSHLFHQGTTAIELLKLQPSARERLKTLISESASTQLMTHASARIDAQAFAVTFVIVTHKPASGKSANLPLFSRIALRKNLRALSLMATTPSYAFVKDTTTVVKTKKKKKSSSSAGPSN